MRRPYVKGRQIDDRGDAAGRRPDEGLELRFSAQPGSAGAAPGSVPGNTYRVPAEVVSGMRQMLTRMVASGQWPRAVALTSALRGEGVSYTALALGAVLSQDMRKPVCLVDANWYWPSGVAPARVETGGGLAAVLDGELKLDNALVRIHDAGAVDEPRAVGEQPGRPATGPNGAGRSGAGRSAAGPNGAERRAAAPRAARPHAAGPYDAGPYAAGSLMLLPAGQMSHTRRVIAARSPEIKAVIAELREQFEYIVFDLPSVLATSDTIALAGLADACCLVVHQGVTPAAIVQEALAAIRHLPVIGVIMNRVQVHMPASLAAQLTAPVVEGATPANVAG